MKIYRKEFNMLYTTYFNRINKLPEETIKLIITRFPPKWFDINQYKNTYICKELSPSKEVLLKYKQDNNWDEYVNAFYEQLNTTMKNTFNKLLKALQDGKDFALICYEKDYVHCHRYLLAQKYVEQNIEWKEI
jgi:uncharacterized protein YeaO (DUF488 family)